MPTGLMHDLSQIRYPRTLRSSRVNRCSCPSDLRVSAPTQELQESFLQEHTPFTGNNHISAAQRSGTVRGVHHEYTVPSLLSARLRKTQNSTVGKTWMLFPTCPPWCGARSRLYEVYNEYISIRFSTCSHIVLCMPGLCPVWHQHFSITTLKCEIKGFTGLWFWLWTIWLLFLERLIQF